MKHKNLLLLGLLPAMAGAANTVPWTETFDTAPSSEWTIIDANNDGETWFHYGNANMRIRYNSDAMMDDWLITPAFQLEAGRAYRFGIDAAKVTYGPEKFEVCAGLAPSAAAMTIPVIAPTEVNSNDFVNTVGEFSVPTTGLYYIGVHGISDPDKLFLCIDNLSLNFGVENNSAAAVSDFSVVPDNAGFLKAELSFRLPTHNLAGQVLTGIEKVEILCGNDLIAELTGKQPGETVVWNHDPAPAGENNYRVAVWSGGVRGAEAVQSAYVGPSIPNPITYLGVGEFTPGQVTLRWNGPTSDDNGKQLDPSLITYKIVTYEVLAESMFYEVDIEEAESISGNEFVHNALAPTAPQKFTAYGIYAVTSAGRSKVFQTPLFPIGTPYGMPYIESAAGGAISTLFRNEVISYEQLTPEWTACADGNAGIRSRDNDGGYIAMGAAKAGDTARYYSGKIDLTSAQEPVMNFYVYNYGNGQNNPDQNELELYISDGRQFVLAKELTVSDFINPGWNRVSVPLTDYIGKTIQFAFQATSFNYIQTPIDAIEIAEAIHDDLPLVNFYLPAEMTLGTPARASVSVENMAASESGLFSVEILRDGDVILSEPFDSLEPAESVIRTFDLTEPVFLTPGNASYSARVVYDDDTVPANNISESIDVLLAQPQFETPRNLTGVKNDRNVALLWEEPLEMTAEPEYLTDDFESYDSFTHTPGSWTMRDADGNLPGKLDLVIPGIHDHQPEDVEPISFFVMDSTLDGSNELYAAHSGQKYLAQFFNAGDLPCDDWAISPELFGGAQRISFYAKSYSSYPAFAETFELLVSSTGTEIADFSLVERKESISNAWIKYEFDLPEGSRYFAIRCISEGCYMMFVDDATFIPAGQMASAPLVGYNVYRNEQRLNTEPVTETSYMDENVPGGDYSYRVSAVYDRGESLPSEDFAVGMESSVAQAFDSSFSAVGGKGIVRIAGLEGKAEILAASGAKIAETIVAGNFAEIALPAGAYLVRNGKTTVKVIVR